MSFILNSEISKSLLQATELYKVVILLSPKLVSDCFKLNSMTVYTTQTYTLFILSQFVQSQMAQNHCSTQDQICGQLVQIICETFHSSQSSKSHQTVEATCWSMSALQSQHLSSWFRLPFVCKINFFFAIFQKHIILTFELMLLDHYLLQFYLSLDTSVKQNS